MSCETDTCAPAVPTPTLGDPADRTLDAAADGQFQAQENRRAGYAADERKLAYLRGYLTRHPHAKLYGGEGAVLLRALEAVEAELADARTRLAVADATIDRMLAIQTEFTAGLRAQMRGQ